MIRKDVMKNYKVWMKQEGGFFVEEHFYFLVLVHEDNGRFEFPSPRIGDRDLAIAKEMQSVANSELPKGQHYRIFQTQLNEVREL